MRQRNGHLRVPLLAAVCGALVLVLAACGQGQQFDPPGQNSGSPQNAVGAFDYDPSHLGKAAVGTSVDVFDAFTTVTTRFTVTDAHVDTSAFANQDPGIQRIDTGMQFLAVSVTLLNASLSPTGCPNPRAETTPCTEFISPLSNFRLIDDQLRQWPTTTGAAEQCSDPQHAARDNLNCSMRQWVMLLNPGDRGIPQGGLKPGMTFQNQLFFLVPSDVHTFSLFFAPFRFPAVAAPATPATGNPAPTKSTPTPVAGLPPYDVAQVTIVV